MSSARHAFLGNNTPDGFHSYFPHLIDYDRAQRIFIIKGSPGSGKSRFMRHIAERVQQAGHAVEYFHCSSDASSLDGVAVPSAGLAWVDGTHPHVIEPRHPGVIDEVVNFFDFSDPELLATHRVDIVALQDEVRMHFQRAFRYLQAARSVLENVAMVREPRSRAHIPVIVKELAPMIQDHTGDIPVVPRHLFTTAFTPTGVVDMLPQWLPPETNVVLLHGGIGFGTHPILQQLATMAQQQGLATELTHYTLYPHRLEHVYVPCLGIAFLTRFPTDPCPWPVVRTYDLTDEYDSDTVRIDSGITGDLLQHAAQALGAAKATRDKVESWYGQAMDFAALERLRTKHSAHVLTMLGA